VSPASLFDRDVREAPDRLAQRKAQVLRMIGRGRPTEAAEDRLRDLEQPSSRIKRRQFSTQNVRDH
jgi:hypothetical protein